MNMIDIQDKLKNLSEDQLVKEMQAPSGTAPQFLVLSEITRRKRMRDSFQNQQAQPTTTIAEEAVASAGVPGGGIAEMARSMAPNSSMAQNTAAMPSQPLPEEPPVQGMYGGGYVQKMAGGRQPADMSNPMVAAWVQKEAQRRGVPVEEVLANLGPTGQALVGQQSAKANRNRMLGLEPVGTSNLNFPTQDDLDQRYADDQSGDTFRMPSQEDLDRRSQERGQRESIFPNSGFTPDPTEIMGFGRPDPSQPPQARPPFTMDYRSQAVDRATARGGREGITDALIASGTPMANAEMFLPDIDGMREAQRQQRIEDQGPYYPGTGAASELNLPAFRQPSGGAGFAAGLRDAASEGPDVDLDLTAPDDGRTWGQRNIGDPMREFFQPIGEAGREIGQAVGDPLRAAGQYVNENTPRFQLGPIRADEEVTISGLANQARGNRVGFDTSYTYPDVPVDDMTAMLSQAGPEFERTGRNPQREVGLPNRQYNADTIFDPMTGVPISGGGVEGEEPLANSTGNWWEDFTMSDDARRQLNETRAKVAAAQAKAAPPAKPKAADQPSGGGITTNNPDVPATPDSSTSVTSRGSGAAVGGANAPTSYEQELRDAMTRAEKRANQDKWMALAQVGLQLMSSKEPTLGGALGEAGIAGLQAYRGSRDAYENERLGLSKSLFDLQQQQAAALAAQKAAGAKASGKALTPDQRMKQIEDRLKFLVQGDALTGETIMPGADGAVAALREEYVNLVNGGGGGTFDATVQ